MKTEKEIKDLLEILNQINQEVDGDNYSLSTAISILEWLFK